LPAVYQIEDIANQSLAIVGYPRRIGDLNEGSMASKVILDLYSQVVNESLTIADWPFARRTVSLVLQKDRGIPAYGGGLWTPDFPPPGWAYQFACPADLIVLRAIAWSPSTYPVLTPKPIRFKLYNDAAILNTNGEPSKCIVNNINPAIAHYTGEVIDPSTWDVGFLSTVVQNLANKIKFILGSQPELLAKDQPQEEAATAQVAASRGP
jgi:hypothetical protein